MGASAQKPAFSRNGADQTWISRISTRCGIPGREFPSQPGFPNACVGFSRPSWAHSRSRFDTPRRLAAANSSPGAGNPPGVRKLRASVAVLARHWAAAGRSIARKGRTGTPLAAARW